MNRRLSKSDGTERGGRGALSRAQAQGQPSCLATLTGREEEIAAPVAQGLTSRQIASELTISEQTVATHVRRILKRLSLHSRCQLTA
jgi:DNA-binding NarL/FixJ family response regulator